MTVSFEKWEGLGNDFVLVEGAPKDAGWVRRVCDRRRGVGADGVLFVEGARSGPLTMTVLNADGSRPEMCGNGIRCVAGYVAAIRLTSNNRFEIATDAGMKSCDVVVHDGAANVVVDMGVTKVLEQRSFEIGGAAHRFTLADAGNPHAVTFEPYAEGDIDAIGPRVSASPPSGYNVEFCRLSPGIRVDVVVWERGVGRTLACGTGACAVAAVVCAAGHAQYGEPFAVGLPGGDLMITIDAATKRATMRGPARRVFTGEVAF